MSSSDAPLTRSPAVPTPANLFLRRPANLAALERGELPQPRHDASASNQFATLAGALAFSAAGVFLLTRGELCLATAGLPTALGLLYYLWSLRVERDLAARRQVGAMLRFGTLLDVETREDDDHHYIKIHYQLDGADAPRSFEWPKDTSNDPLPAPGARLAFAYEADDNLELL